MTREESIGVREYCDKLFELHRGEHVQLEKSIALASTEIDRCLREMNQIREQINNERGRYLAREIYDREHGSLAGRVSNLELTASRAQGSIWMLGGIISFLTIGVNIVIHFWVK